MTYIVNENCIRCKYTDCVEVCPVDCFYEGENMLVIHPDECIDCGVCEPECPVDAIKPDTEPGAEKWLELNRQYSAVCPISRERNLHRPMPTLLSACLTNSPNTSAPTLARVIRSGRGECARDVGTRQRIHPRWMVASLRSVCSRGHGDFLCS